MRIGNRYAEMFTLEAQGSLLAFCNRYADALPFIERGLALADAIGAKRYQATLLTERAEVLLRAGSRRTRRARTSSARSRSFARPACASGARWRSAFARGCRTTSASASAIARRPRRCSRKGARATITSATTASASTTRLPAANGRVALAHAAALERYAAAEPLPYSDFLVARARVLVGLAARPADPMLRAELSKLRAEAARVRWPIDWPGPAGASD